MSVLNVMASPSLSALVRFLHNPFSHSFLFILRTFSDLHLNFPNLLFIFLLIILVFYQISSFIFFFLFFALNFYIFLFSPHPFSCLYLCFYIFQISPFFYNDLNSFRITLFHNQFSCHYFLILSIIFNISNFKISLPLTYCHNFFQLTVSFVFFSPFHMYLVSYAFSVILSFYFLQYFVMLLF